MNPFEYANDLMKKKDYDGDCIRERKDYKPFFINRSLSYHPDLIHYANMMNENPMLEVKAHYDFLHQTIEKKSRKKRFVIFSLSNTITIIIFLLHQIIRILKWIH